MILAWIGLLVAGTWAGPPTECRAVKWPFSREQSKAELTALFKRAEPDVLTHYLISEVTAPVDGKLAYPMARFLSESATTRGMKGFYDLVLWSAEVRAESEVPKSVQIAEVCHLLKKAEEMDARKP